MIKDRTGLQSAKSRLGNSRTDKVYSTRDREIEREEEGGKREGEGEERERRQKEERRNNL